MSVKFPPIKWAQDAGHVFMSIECVDATDVNIDVNEETNSVVFSTIVREQKYGFNLELFEKISKDESKWNLKGRYVLINIAKAEESKKEEWWGRLTKDKTKN